MIISKKLKERFVKDYKIPIRLFASPYFEDRLQLYDKYFDTMSKYKSFISVVEKYNNEEEYFAAYNKVKDDAINYIKSTEAYNRFNSLDMNNFVINNEYRNLPSKDIYHASNIGRKFISIDMRKANFSSLHNFDSSIFGNANCWEDFIKKFTDNENIINSKYIREVILGNCNPKRHITYEKYLMSEILTNIIMTGISLNNIVFFSNDEIIFDVTDVCIDTFNEFYNNLISIINKSNLSFKIEIFTLIGIKKNDTIIGYFKKLTNDTIEFKCINSIDFPFILRKLNNESITDFDLIFEFEGNLAKFIESPNIEVIS